MTALDLTQLAADCEARAAAGEKPAMERVGVDDYLDRYQGQKFCWLVQMSGQTIVGITRALDGHGGRESAWSVNHLPLAGTPRFAIERTIAAQLFAEALLAAATAPLHAARIAALEAALAEAKDVACKWRDHHAEKPDRATYWNDLAVRWQDALAGQDEATPALRLMEDAPRDGSIYLVWCSINRQWIPTRWSFEMEWPMSWSGACPRGDVHLAGWLPLPAPPASQAGGDK